MKWCCVNPVPLRSGIQWWRSGRCTANVCSCWNYHAVFTSIDGNNLSYFLQIYHTELKSYPEVGRSMNSTDRLVCVLLTHSTARNLTHEIPWYPFNGLRATVYSIFWSIRKFSRFTVFIWAVALSRSSANVQRGTALNSEGDMPPRTTFAWR